MLEGETYERQQLERKTGDLTNKLAASRQALAVTQTALSGLQDATEESSRTRDIRDIEIEKYLSEIKVKDSKIAALEHRAKDFDDHMNINLSKKDETIHKLQKKLTDALDTAYKAENDASTVSKDLSIARSVQPPKPPYSHGFGSPRNYKADGKRPQEQDRNFERIP